MSRGETIADSITHHSSNLIDLLKFIASFLIITIHCNPLTSFGENISLYFVSTIPRLAVPFFFACSGFFFFNKLIYDNEKIKNCKENRKRLFKYLTRIGMLYLLWSLIYLIWSIPEWQSTGWLSVKAFIDYGIAFFCSSSYYHLWYLLDLIYAITIGYILMSLFKRKYVLFLSVLLYFLGILTYSYSWINVPLIGFLSKISSFCPAIWDSFTRTLALMLIGYFSVIIRRSNKINCILFVTSFVFLCIEVFLLNKFSNNHNSFSYIVFTIPVTHFLMSTVLQISIDISDEFSRLLRHVSTMVYLLHPIIIDFVLSMKITTNSLLNYAFIFILTLALSYSVVMLSRVKYIRFFKYLY